MQLFYALSKQFATAGDGTGLASAATSPAGANGAGSGPPPSLTPVSKFQQPIRAGVPAQPEVTQQNPQAMPVPHGPPVSTMSGVQPAPSQQKRDTSKCCGKLPSLCTCFYTLPQQPYQPPPVQSYVVGPAQQAFLVQQQQQAAAARQAEFVNQQAAELKAWQEKQVAAMEVERQTLEARVQQEAERQKQAADGAAMQQAQAAHLMAQQQQQERQAQQDAQNLLHQAPPVDDSLPQTHLGSVPVSVAPQFGSTAAPAVETNSPATEQAAPSGTKSGPAPFSRRATKVQPGATKHTQYAVPVAADDGGLQAVPVSDDEAEEISKLPPDRIERRAAEYKPRDGAAEAASRRARDLQALQKESRASVMDQKRKDDDIAPAAAEFVDCSDDGSVISDEQASLFLMQNAQSLLPPVGMSGVQADGDDAHAQQPQMAAPVDSQQPLFQQASLVPQQA